MKQTSQHKLLTCITCISASNLSWNGTFEEIKTYFAVVHLVCHALVSTSFRECSPTRVASLSPNVLIMWRVTITFDVGHHTPWEYRHKQNTSKQKQCVLFTDGGHFGLISAPHVVSVVMRRKIRLQGTHCVSQCIDLGVKGSRSYRHSKGDIIANTPGLQLFSVYFAFRAQGQTQLSSDDKLICFSKRFCCRIWITKDQAICRSFRDNGQRASMHCDSIK